MSSLAAYGQLDENGVRPLALGADNKGKVIAMDQKMVADVFKLFPRTQPSLYETFKAVGESAAYSTAPKAIERCSYKYLKQGYRSFMSNYEVVKEFQLHVLAREDAAAKKRGFWPPEVGYLQHWGGVLGMIHASHLEMQKQMECVLGFANAGTAADHAAGMGRHNNKSSISFPQLEFWRVILAVPGVYATGLQHIQALSQEPTMQQLSMAGPVKEYLEDMCLTTLPAAVQLAAVRAIWLSKGSQHPIKEVCPDMPVAREVIRRLISEFHDKHMLRLGGMFQLSDKEGRMQSGQYAKHPYQAHICNPIAYSITHRLEDADVLMPISPSSSSDSKPQKSAKQQKKTPEFNSKQIWLSELVRIAPQGKISDEILGEWRAEDPALITKYLSQDVGQSNTSGVAHPALFKWPHRPPNSRICW